MRLYRNSRTGKGWPVGEHDLKVRDLMSDEVTTMQHDETLILADDLMRLGRIRHIPIVGDDGKRVVGVLSQRDLFRCALAKAIGYSNVAQAKMMEVITIGEVMNSDVRTIGPDESVASAAKLMLKHKIGCLPVVEDSLLVGILTEADFVRQVLREE
jgi:CBS domain-containing membrane protein